MSENPTQSGRIAELTTPLGKDKLLLNSFHASERLSTPFEIRIQANSKDPDIDFNKLLGKNCGIRQNTVGKKTRYFNGVLVEASWFGERDGLFAYELTLRPWLWLLTQTSDCRIFQNQSVVDIIKTVFTKAGFSDFEFKLIESYQPMEYCVQYRETHFDFVSRLMERFGIYYFFKHEDSKHTLVLADAKNSHQPIPSLPECVFAGMGERTRDNREYVKQWLSGRRFRPGKVVINAFDFAKPTANMKANKASPGGYTHDSLELYDYPEKYKSGEEGSKGATFANARLQALQAEDRRRFASGDAPSLFPGGLVKLKEHPHASENAEYLVVSAEHSFVAELYASGSSTASGDSYTGNYELQLSERPFKAPLETRRPIVHGPQTAIVVGPSGEEIHTDEHGRVKLKFHWDRESPGDEKSSRWVRVGQIWSGKKWGGIVIPRIGMEVIVEFIEGDPDRPLVVGTVYNGDNTPPFGLPDNKTQSGVKTRSTKGAGENNYNELVFEDKKGGEFVRFHAEKDLNSTIEDYEKRLIKGKNKSKIGETTRETILERGDDILDIAGDNKITIGNDQKVKIKNDQTIKVGNNILIEAGSQIVLKVGSSTITMKEGLIEIKASKLETKTDITDMTGTAMIKLTAGVIKLN